MTTVVIRLERILQFQEQLPTISDHAVCDTTMSQSVNILVLGIICQSLDRSVSFLLGEALGKSLRRLMRM